MTGSAMRPSSRAAWAAVRALVRALLRRSPTFSKICSAWPASAGAAAASAAPICATTWKSRWKRPSRARPRRSRFRSPSPANPVRVPAPRPAPSRRPARPAAGLGGDGRARGSFTLSATAPAGAGRVTRERTLSVNIPQGVEDGTRIRLAGEGEAGVRGGPPGDLYIFLSLSTHQFFQRDGADLHCRVPISMVTAALGGEFEVPTIDKGKTKVKIPAGAQSGRRFRIASKGMPVLRSRQTGDMYVQVVVETPQNLTKKQQELLAEFEKLSSGATQPEAAGFFTKVKDFFGTRATP